MTELKPYTQYAIYVQTYMVAPHSASERIGARSHIIYARTEPAGKPLPVPSTGRMATHLTPDTAWLVLYPYYWLLSIIIIIISLLLYYYIIYLSYIIIGDVCPPFLCLPFLVITFRPSFRR